MATNPSVAAVAFPSSPPAAIYIALGVLAAALAQTIAHSYRVSFSGVGDSCCVSDWLINYSGGFVRRGLSGTCILWIARILGTSPRAIVFAVLAVCYTLFFVSLAVLVARARKLDWLELLLAVSPFATLFPAFHPVAGQRKEILMLSLAAVAGATGLGRLDSVAKYIGWSLVFAAIVAIHDGSIFFLPLFIIYLRIVTPPASAMGYRAALLLLPATAVFFMGYIRSGSVDVATICATIEAGAKGNWCGAGSAVAWLNANATYGVESVIRGYTASSTVFVTGTLLPGLAGLMPALATLRTDRAAVHRAVADLPLKQLFVGLSGLSIAVLFCVADDGNRWFYITTVFLTLMHFSIRRSAIPGMDA